MHLKEWLKENEITQREFANQYGYREEHVSRVMSGRKRPSRRMIAMIFGVTGGQVDGLDDIVNPVSGGQS